MKKGIRSKCQEGKMKVLGIDPGPVRSAFVVFDGKMIHEKGIVPNLEILSLINWCDFDPYHVVIEAFQSFGMPVGQEVFTTCIWIGRFVQAAESSARLATLLYRKDIKLHLCGSVRAKDGNIRQALLDKVGKQGVKKDPGPTYGVKSDEWQALACAVYFLEGKLGK